MSRKLLSFIMLFAVTFCFIGGCKDDGNKEPTILVKDGKEVVATINGVYYTADDVYGDFLNSNASADYIYEKLEDLLIKTAVPVTDSMRNRITNEVEKWKKDIKENSTINGTSYKDDLKAALEEEGVTSEEELISKKIFEVQEKTITDQYWRDNEESYYNDYLSNRHVYHVSQILVTFSNNNNYDYFDVAASNTQMKKMYDVINELVSGESFYNVALKYSDDTTSKDNGGDLGIISLNDSKISNEVKYALASYSIYFENAQLTHPDYLNTTYGDGIEAIPQKYVDLLVKENADGKKLYEDDGYYINSSSSWLKSSERVYGRRIIFNNLFNSRTFRFIQSDGEDNVESYDNIRMPKEEVYGFNDKGTQNILVNDLGLPILVVRSDEGIHFISINKSAFAGEEELKEYYSKKVDETDDYITYLEKSINDSDKQARLEKLNSFANTYATLKIEGSEDATLAGNSNFIRYDMFMSYLGKTYNGIKFDITNEKVKNIVVQYITAKKAYAQQKIDNAFFGGYELYSNTAEYSDSPVVVKNIPILKCLEKECIYTYTNGFELSEGGSN